MGDPRVSGSVHHTRSTRSPTPSTRNGPGGPGTSPGKRNKNYTIVEATLKMNLDEVTNIIASSNSLTLASYILG